jgi:hypothetical protein
MKNFGQAEINLIRKKFQNISPYLDERSRRIWVGNEAKSYGHGGIVLVWKATGVSHKTIRKGVLELKKSKRMPGKRIRQEGAGRKKAAEKQPGLFRDLETLIEPVTRGDPMSPLRWTSKSTGKLAEALVKHGYQITDDTVGSMLKTLEYSLQGNRKTLEGANNPDRDGQFEHINTKAGDFLKEHQPVISVDTKKKENIGNFKNNGQEYAFKHQPEKVQVHDFMDKKLGKAAPYGVYDPNDNTGWVNIGIDHDTAEFAVESIRMWWREMGKSRYPAATKLLITADGGGSNGSRVKLWKTELQKLADELQMDIHVCHFPPGTSKWNKIEHKMFSYISKNWRGHPLVNLETIVNLIANTTTKKGLKIQVRVDHKKYPIGIKVSQIELDNIFLEKDPYHGEWNYTIKPHI